MLTKVFQSGNSLAIRIPKALAFGSPHQEVEIYREEDRLIIQTKKGKAKSLKDVPGLFAKFSKDFSIPGRGQQAQKKRDAL